MTSRMVMAETFSFGASATRVGWGSWSIVSRLITNGDVLSEKSTVMALFPLLKFRVVPDAETSPGVISALSNSVGSLNSTESVMVREPRPLRSKMNSRSSLRSVGQS